MLVRMWRKGNPCTLMVRMQIGAACGKQYKIPQKVKNRTTIWSSHFNSGYLSARNEITNLRRYVHPTFTVALQAKVGCASKENLGRAAKPSTIQTTRFRAMDSVMAVQDTQCQQQWSLTQDKRESTVHQNRLKRYHNQMLGFTYQTIAKIHQRDSTAN